MESLIKKIEAEASPKQIQYGISSLQLQKNEYRDLSERLVEDFKSFPELLIDDQTAVDNANDKKFIDQIASISLKKTYKTHYRTKSLKTVPCKFYAINRCKFGEKCRFLHEFRPRMAQNDATVQENYAHARSMTFPHCGGMGYPELQHCTSPYPQNSWNSEMFAESYNPGNVWNRNLANKLENKELPRQPYRNIADIAPFIPRAQESPSEAMRKMISSDQKLKEAKNAEFRSNFFGQADQRGWKRCFSPGTSESITKADPFTKQNTFTKGKNFTVSTSNAPKMLDIPQ